jgi:erythromycin esterase
MKRFLAAGLAVALLAADTTLEEAWLKKFAAPLRSIDPADEDFADLAPFGRAVGNSRVVVLGEQTHADGATFHAKTRLIKYLHQKCGFDVLAFESGLYDGRKAWQLLRDGRPAREAAPYGIFGIWAQSRQVRPLIDYLGRHARGPAPLELCGFDCQFTGRASSEFLADDAVTFFGKLPAGTLPVRDWERALKALDRLGDAEAAIDEADKSALDRCVERIAPAKPSDKLPAGELAFWKQFFASAAAWAAARVADPANKDLYGNHRDAQMARNLLWLAREAHPRRKIIVWAASFHAMRNPGTITEAGRPTPRYQHTVTLGHDVSRALGRDVYSVMFLAAEGETKLPWADTPTRLKPPPAGSLDDLFARAGCVNAFVDFRAGVGAPAGEWLRVRRFARPLGYSPMLADWTDVFDGVVFTKTMFGSDRIDDE